MNKTKILVAGLGGVGGFFGGQLARAFQNDDSIDIYFLARGKHLSIVKSEGLTIIHGNEEYVVHPKLATDQPNEIGIVDYILVCCKTYDLVQLMMQLQPCINEKTSILTLLNGVESASLLQKIAPKASILNGCVYVVSYLKAPGFIENKGNIQRIFFGPLAGEETSAHQLAIIFNKAKMDATLCKDIEEVVWEKFYMIGANSTATSYFKCPIGELFADVQKYNFLLQLLNEINEIALVKGLTFKEDMIAKTLLKLKSLPTETTSSMQRDFMKNNGKTELESITGYVVKLGQESGIHTPTFKEAYQKLSVQ
jgi:2-dehydropantoate 2-reductase